MKPKIKLKPAMHIMIAVGTNSALSKDNLNVDEEASPSTSKTKIRGTGAATQGIYANGSMV